MTGAVPTLLSKLRDGGRRALERLSPRQRQYVTLLGLLTAGFGLLWLVFASNGSTAERPGRAGSASPSGVTHIGVMAPGQQVDPVDQWVGTAGSKLAQYETEREEQGRLNRDRQAFEAITMRRFAELEQRLTSAAQASPAQAAPPALPPAPPPPSPLSSPAFPPAADLPLPTRALAGELPPPVAPGTSTITPSIAPSASQLAATLTRVQVTERTRPPDVSQAQEDATRADDPAKRSVATFLPVSFTRGTLIGGLDAPTGGQAQSNPHPVLIRLSDNAVLPNRFRGEYRECFVVAAGYGDISSERAYLRTESLSCVRDDGSALEVKIQGSVYGEDGKVGMRGRLVTKQGQLLANALLAGVVGGIGQGVSTASTTFSTSPLGAVGTAQGADAYRAGVGTGVGRALDRLAQYYIKLAENTFPVIEIDAAREIDVVITRGVRIDGPPAQGAGAAQHSAAVLRQAQEDQDDRDY